MIITVLGDINPQDSQNVLMHEHIQCLSNDMKVAFGDKWLDEEKLENYAVEVLKILKEKFGLGIFVDGTAIDLGRNAALLKSVSQKSGVNIVASTGLYYYPSMLSCGRSAEELAEIFLYECENGLDGTDVKPGILKCAADGVLTKDTEKRLSALSIVQAKTKLPMYAHCSHNDNIALRTMQIFEKHNVNPQKTVFGHVSRRLDSDYLESILKEGYYICIDQSWKGQEEAVAKEVLKICEKGYEDKILFSHDYPLYNDFETAAKTGKDFLLEKPIDRIAFLYDRIIPQLEKIGVTKNICDKFLRLNAIEILNID